MAIESVKIEENMPDGSKREINTSDAVAGKHHYLVMFNALIDLDFSIMRMIQAEYNNPKYIDQKIMGMTTQQVRGALINRDDPNPVTICMKTKDVADKIYKEIMTTRYRDLLEEKKYLSITGIFFLMSVYVTKPEVDITVVCSNEIEAAVIKKYHEEMNTLVVNSFEEIDPNEYTDFIFKSKYDIYKFLVQGRVFNEKRILLMNYKFNVSMEEKPYPDLELGYYLWNIGYSKLCLIDTYSREQKDFATLKFIVNNNPEN